MIWISIKQAARLMNSTEQWARKLIKRGKLQARAALPRSRNVRGRQVSLDSLPTDAQARYLNVLKRDPESRGGNLPTEADGGIGLPPSAASVLATVNDEDELRDLADYAEALRALETAIDLKTAKASAARRFGISVRTIEIDFKNLRAEGIGALQRKKRADAGSTRIADRHIIAIIHKEYLQLHKPRIAEIHRAVAKEYQMSGLGPPSYGFVYRVIQSIAPDLVARFRDGERKFDDKFAYISFRKKPELPRQWVQADHHPCDRFVLFPNSAIGRPWITAFYDLCTNEILGFQLTREKPVGKGTYPGAAAIGLALRATILRKHDPKWPSSGLFEHLQVDLGRDFRSQHVRAICADLGIEINYTRGYHGKSKGNVEAWFAIMENGTRALPGYCGNKPENNPQRQTLKPEPLDPKKLLTIDEYESALRKWIVDDYHFRPSKALNGLSPMEALNDHIKNGFRPREVRDERVLDLLLMRRKSTPVKVHNFGVRIFNRVFVAPELLSLVGQEIDGVFWDPAKIGEVLLYQKEKFICVAKNKELLDYGASEETLARERDLKRQQKRDLQNRMDEFVKRAQYPNPLARAAAEDRREKVMEEERVKIAAGGTADSVPVLVPKYAKAAKKLRAVPMPKPAPAPVRRVYREGWVACPECGELSENIEPCKERECGKIMCISCSMNHRHPNPWLNEDSPPSSAEIFKRETNSWLEEDDD